MDAILVVDDNEDTLNLVQQILETEGKRKVVCASCGEDALQVLREKTFGLMITDYNMPGLNGLELAPKALAIAPLMHIIMFTGDFTSGIAKLAEKAGIEAVLDKPFSPEKILRLIRVVTGKPRVQAAAV